MIKNHDFLVQVRPCRSQLATRPPPRRGLGDWTSRPTARSFPGDCADWIIVIKSIRRRGDWDDWTNSEGHPRGLIHPPLSHGSLPRTLGAFHTLSGSAQPRAGFYRPPKVRPIVALLVLMVAGVLGLVRGVHQDLPPREDPRPWPRGRVAWRFRALQATSGVISDRGT